MKKSVVFGSLLGLVLNGSLFSMNDDPQKGQNQDERKPVAEANKESGIGKNERLYNKSGEKIDFFSLDGNGTLSYYSLILTALSTKLPILEDQLKFRAITRDDIYVMVHPGQKEIAINTRGYNEFINNLHESDGVKTTVVRLAINYDCPNILSQLLSFFDCSRDELNSYEKHSTTMLEAALRVGDVALVDALVQKGALPRERLQKYDDDSYPSTTACAIDGGVAVLKYVIKEFPDVVRSSFASRWYSVNGSLEYAISDSKSEEFKLLFDTKYPDSNKIPADELDSLISSAVRKNESEIFILLWKHKGDNPSCKSSLLAEAIKKSNWIIIDFLISNIKKETVANAICECIVSRDISQQSQQEGFLRTLETLIEKSEIDVNASICNGEQQTLLTNCVDNCNAVKIILGLPGIDVNATNKDGQTALCVAIECKNVEAVDLLLQKPKIDVKTINKKGQNPLHVAAGQSSDRIIKLLLERSDVNKIAKDSKGRTPLFIAASRSSLPIVELVLEYVQMEKETLYAAVMNESRFYRRDIVGFLLGREDVDPNATFNGKTPLVAAIERGDKEVIQLLLQNKADPSIQYEGVSPLVIAARKGYDTLESLLSCSDIGKSDTDVLKVMNYVINNANNRLLALLVKRCDMSDNIKRQLIILAVESKNLDIFKTVFERTSDPERALYAAAVNGNIEVLKFLKELKDFNPNLNLEGEDGPVICIAVGNGNVDFVKYLVGMPNTDVNVQDSHGNTPLHMALAKGDTEVAKFLLQTSLDEINRITEQQEANRRIKSENNKNKKNKKNRKQEPQHLTPIEDSPRIIKINANNNEGQTPLHIAAQCGDADITQLLLQFKGVTVYKNKERNDIKFGYESTNAKAKDNKGRTPLHTAAESGKRTTVQQLLGYNDIDAKDNDGKTAIDLACASGHPEVVQLLMEKGAKINYAKVLLEVAEKGNIEMFNTLLANHKFEVSDLQNALYGAVQNGHIEIAKILIDKLWPSVNAAQRYDIMCRVYRDENKRTSKASNSKDVEKKSSKDSNVQEEESVKVENESSKDSNVQGEESVEVKKESSEASNVQGKGSVIPYMFQANEKYPLKGDNVSEEKDNVSEEEEEEEEEEEAPKPKKKSTSKATKKKVETSSESESGDDDDPKPVKKQQAKSARRK